MRREAEIDRRKQKLDEDGKCKDKHLYSKKDFWKALFSGDTSKKLTRLVCGEQKSIYDIQREMKEK